MAAAALEAGADALEQQAEGLAAALGAELAAGCGVLGHHGSQGCLPHKTAVPDGVLVVSCQPGCVWKLDLGSAAQSSVCHACAKAGGPRNSVAECRSCASFAA